MASRAAPHPRTPSPQRRSDHPVGKPWELSTVPLSLSVCCGSRGVHGHGRFDAEVALLLCVSPRSREDLACTLCAVRPSPVLVLVLSTSPMGIHTTPEGPAAHGHLYTCIPQPHQMGRVLGPHALPDHRRRLLGLRPMESAEKRHEPQPQHCHQKPSSGAASGSGERGAGQRQAYGLGRGRSVQAALPTAPRPCKCLLDISGVSTNHTQLLLC